MSDSHKKAVIYDDAYNFCNDRNLGLAVWKTAEEYEDIKYISEHHANWEYLWTALNNENEEDCNTDHGQYTNCDDKLVWRQNKCGPHELYKGVQGHNK